jgi:hypothetical protein
MMLADRLKMTVEQILQMTTLELDLWAGYLKYEHDKHTNQQMKNNVPRRRR